MRSSGSHVLAGRSIQQQRLTTADHEAREFGLLPRGDSESIADYIRRVDNEKTAIMLERWRKRGFRV